MSGKRILVVDDEPLVRQSIELMLSLDGHTIDLASSGFEALEKHEPGKYHLVLTDNRMVGMTGLQLAREIKARDPAQPVVLFSGSPPLGPAPDCDLVLLKPFSTAELRKVVMAAASGSRLCSDLLTVAK